MAHWGGALLLTAVTRGRLRQLCGHALRYWFEVCMDDSGPESGEEDALAGLSDDDGLGLDEDGGLGLDEDGGLPLGTTAPDDGDNLRTRASPPFESLAASFGCAPTAASPYPSSAVASASRRVRVGAHSGVGTGDWPGAGA